MKQQSLQLTREIELVRLSRHNANSSILSLRELLNSVDSLYPGIENWLDSKVLPGLRDESRAAYLVYHQGKPIASAISKKGDDAKICNLRIMRDWKELGLGRLLFCLLALSVSDKARRIHFTIPESTWIETKAFFQEYGFHCVGLAEKQYRPDDPELACVSDARSVLKTVSFQLPRLISGYALNGLSNDCSLILSIRPEYAVAILEGRKRVEIRRHFSEKWKGSKVLLYASSPQCQFVGEVEIDDVFCDSPSRIWVEHGDFIGCSRGDYFAYCEGSRKVFAIRLGAVRGFRTPVLRTSVENVLGTALRPPQSYLQVLPGSTWLQAATISCFLQTPFSIGLDHHLEEITK